MAVLAISEDSRSAAIAADDRLVAAFTAPSAHSIVREGFATPREGLVELCLRQSSLRLSDLSMVAHVTGTGSRVSPVEKEAFQVTEISSEEAQLAQAALAAGDQGLLIVVEDAAQPEVLIGRVQDGLIRESERCGRLSAILQLRRQVAAVLGLSGSNATRQLEQLADQGEPDFVADLRTTLRVANTEVTVNGEALAQVVARVAGTSPGPLGDAATLHRGVQQARAALAASVQSLVVGAFAAMADRHGLPSPAVPRVGAAGSFFVIPTLNAAIDRAVGGILAVAAVPESAGAVLGAALQGCAGRQRLRHLALGPTFGEQEIKRTLENCRLEYVYEPDWSRLMTRVSGLLAAGRVVGWYQEPLDFGPRSLGSRSILCDPSNRYARDNINSYVLQRSVDEPLSISVACELAQDCFTEPVDSPFMLLAAHVRSSFAGRLAAAMDRRGMCAVHTVDEAGHSGLRELLDVHHSRSGVPGLINVGLCDASGALVVTPRDAVQAAFGSAVDVLVLGRFIVSKDYWLLRSDRSSVG